MTLQEYNYLKGVAYDGLLYLLKKKKLYLSELKIDQVITDSISTYYTRYIARSRPVFYPPTIMRYCLIEVLWGRNKFNERSAYRNIVQLEEWHQEKEKDRELDDDYFDQLTTAHSNSDYIIFILYTEKQYKKAILRIEKITSREWIYSHAVQLRKVWEILHYERRQKNYHQRKNKA